MTNTTDGSRNEVFPDSVVGGHAAWLWRAVQSGGADVDEEQLGEHFTREARLHPRFAEPSRFRAYAESLLVGVNLGELRAESPTQIVIEFATASGLELELAIVFDPGDGRIAMAVERLPGGSSVTAPLVAGWRAAHLAIDTPVILDDTLAGPLSGELGLSLLAATREHPAEPHVRWHVAARSRWAEDTIVEAASDGVDQYVLLGAGLDTFAYRHPAARDGLCIFEVDQPSSQAWKRRRLTDLGVEIPKSVTYVPVDFEAESFDALLLAAGFDPSHPSVVAWLGVAVYLTGPAIGATLDAVAGWAPGTQLVFDYVVPERLWDSFGEPYDGDEARGTAAAVAAAGEPFISFFDAAGVEELLRSKGYADVEHLDYRGIRARYMDGRGPTPGPSPFMATVKATVVGSAPNDTPEG